MLGVFILVLKEGPRMAPLDAKIATPHVVLHGAGRTGASSRHGKEMANNSHCLRSPADGRVPQVRTVVQAG